MAVVSSGALPTVGSSAAAFGGKSQPAPKEDWQTAHPFDLWLAVQFRHCSDLPQLHQPQHYSDLQPLRCLQPLQQLLRCSGRLLLHFRPLPGPQR